MNNNIKNVAAGVLSGLESLNNIVDENQKNKRVEEEKNKKIENNIDINEQKSKRSFMLTHNQIKELYELKQEFINKDLSTMVGEAIDDYYNKNKRVNK